MCNANPVEGYATVPALPPGTIVGFVKGGVYYATAEELNHVYEKYGGNKTGRYIREQLNKYLDDDTETREFYRGTNTFERALILAWYTSELNPQYMEG